MHIEIPNAETLGALIYDAANLDPASPPAGGCEEIADALDVIIHECPIRRWVDVFTLHDRRRLVVRRGLDLAQYNWATGWGLAALRIENEPWGALLARRQRDALCGETATWLAAPTVVFAEAYCALDLDVRQLANEFALPEAATALRIAELPSGPSCVVAIENKRTVLRRGPLLAGFDDRAVRSLATNRRAKSVRRVELAEGVALFSRAS